MISNVCTTFVLKHFYPNNMIATYGLSFTFNTLHYISTKTLECQLDAPSVMAHHLSRTHHHHPTRVSNPMNRIDKDMEVIFKRLPTSEFGKLQINRNLKKYQHIIYCPISRNFGGPPFWCSQCHQPRDVCLNGASPRPHPGTCDLVQSESNL